MDVVYGTSAFTRERGNFPDLPVVNMFAETVQTEQHPALQSRPGLANSGTAMGVGPVKSLFQIDGVLDGSLFGLSDNKLYKGTTNLGTVNGTGYGRVTGFDTFVFANQGASLYGYDGTTFAAVATPGSFDVLTMCVGSSRLIVIDKGTGHFYWSNVLDKNIQALSFATAENSPDKLKDCLFLGDTLILFGTETVEFWPVSTDPNLPFQPMVGRVFPVGIKDTGCASLFGTGFAWVSNRNQVCAADPQNIISFPGLEAKIEASSSVSLWRFQLEGVEFLALRLDTETWVFSQRSGQWSQFESFGQTNWIPQCYGGGYFGSSINGNLIQWTNDHLDFSDILERRFRAGVPLDNGTSPLYNVRLRTNPGQTPYLTGTYADPTVEMRISRDGGFTWTDYKSVALGAAGAYRQWVQFVGLGFFSYPGVLLEFRVADPVPFRVSNVTANEPYARM